jgi:hypothetical protein
MRVHASSLRGEAATSPTSSFNSSYTIAPGLKLLHQSLSAGHRSIMTKRTAEVERKTKETNIRILLNLDGCGQAEIASGIPFF